MRHRHDPRTCETCRDGGEALFQGCMILFAVLVIAAYVGLGYLLAQPVIHLTPMEPTKAYVISYVGLMVVAILAYPVCAIVHMLNNTGVTTIVMADRASPVSPVSA